MRMSVNWACYVAYQHAENLAYKEAQQNKKNEDLGLAKYLDELKEISQSRGS